MRMMNKTEFLNLIVGKAAKCLKELDDEINLSMEYDLPSNSNYIYFHHNNKKYETYTSLYDMERLSAQNFFCSICQKVNSILAKYNNDQ